MNPTDTRSAARRALRQLQVVNGMPQVLRGRPGWSCMVKRGFVIVRELTATFKRGVSFLF
jgi:hypothetical protein